MPRNAGEKKKKKKKNKKREKASGRRQSPVESATTEAEAEGRLAP